MGWAILALLALLAGLALWRFGRMPRSALELVGAALLLGVAGYAWQGSPGLPGRPTPPPADTAQPDGAFARTRGTMTDKMGGDAQVLDTADAFHRQGLDRYAVGIIKGALEKRPNSADLWVGLGNALVMHNQGMMSPAAALAFGRAERIDPKHPGPAFFSGLAYAQAGQADQAVATWRALLARAPAGAAWRREVEARLAELEGAMGTSAPPTVAVERQATDAAAGTGLPGPTDAKATAR